MPGLAESVLVVVDPQDYPLLLQELDSHGGGSDATTRARFAAKAFAHTARYYTMVAAYLAARHAPATEPFPGTLPLLFDKVQDLRYGENPHQIAAFYRDVPAAGASVATSSVLQGKDLSFNNIADADTAVECVRQFDGAACHPCHVFVPLDQHAGKLLRMQKLNELLMFCVQFRIPRSLCYKRGPIHYEVFANSFTHNCASLSVFGLKAIRASTIRQRPMISKPC